MTVMEGVEADLAAAKEAGLDVGTHAIEDYRAMANEVAIYLNRGDSVMWVIEPGNGTRYAISLTPWNDTVCLDRNEILAHESDSVMIALPYLGGRVWWLRPDYNAPSYLEEKLKLGHTDAIVVSTFMGCVWAAMAEEV